MRKKNWILLVLIVLCLAVFFGYRTVDQIRTDTKAPTIDMDTQPLEVSVQDSKSTLLQGITAADNVDGDVTGSIVVESIRLLDSDGSVSVGYAAFDSSGNVAKATREAKYTDYESPKFTLSDPLIYTYGHSFDILSTIGAVDVIDGDIQHRVRATVTEEKAISEMGIHKVQFQVTNSLGDTVTEIFPVEVCAADTYNATLTLKDYLIYLPVGSRFNAASYLDTFTFLGEEHRLGTVLPADYSLKTRGQVRTSAPGTYTVEYRVTYTDRDERNPEFDKDYIGYSKLIVVVEG